MSYILYDIKIKHNPFLKINELYLIKLKNFCSSKDIKKIKRQATDWYKILANQ